MMSHVTASWIPVSLQSHRSQWKLCSCACVFVRVFIFSKAARSGGAVCEETGGDWSCSSVPGCSSILSSLVSLCLCLRRWYRDRNRGSSVTPPGEAKEKTPRRMQPNPTVAGALTLHWFLPFFQLDLWAFVLPDARPLTGEGRRKEHGLQTSADHHRRKVGAHRNRTLSLNAEETCHPPDTRRTRRSSQTTRPKWKVRYGLVCVCALSLRRSPADLEPLLSAAAVQSPALCGRPPVYTLKEIHASTRSGNDKYNMQYIFFRYIYFFCAIVAQPLPLESTNTCVLNADLPYCGPDPGAACMLCCQVERSQHLWNGRIETDMMPGRSLTILRPVFDFLNLLGFKIWRLVQSRWATSRTRTRTSGWWEVSWSLFSLVLILIIFFYFCLYFPTQPPACPFGVYVGYMGTGGSGQQTSWSPLMCK